MSKGNRFIAFLLLTVSLFISVQRVFAVVLPMDTVARRVVPTEPRRHVETDTLLVGELSDTASILLPSPKHEAPISTDTTIMVYSDSLTKVVGDTLKLNRFENWQPNSIRAMWLAMVFPGGGQIYNRKYWKLPIVYGGVVGCIYAVNWNSQMLKDYSQAYQDITDKDPTTNSHLEMLPLGYNISGREEHFKTIFKRKKDFYRRNRDLSIFCIAGVYLLSVVDAYVDAELSTFDIGRELSVQLSPNMISTDMMQGTSLMNATPCISINFNY
ncbi:MAG: hypothetical protein IIW93_02205 [Bacteroidaceae bacterium]|nr:hypothetical protein [Bacteroidaceae bacterium]MBQ5911894.1 hypothetical protein [Bacteroidaceae bacterium]